MTNKESLKTIEIGLDKVIKNVTFRVLRYAGGGDNPVFRDYEIPVIRGMTVLEGLIYIKENLDATISMRYSCRMGVCGSCGMLINGKPALACQTQILDLDVDTVKLEPLPNYPNTKDLVPDLDSLFEKHRAIKPYIIRDNPQELESPTREFLQSPEELEEYLQFSYCIKCGICLSVCPTVSTDPNFLGPQALGQTARFMLDTRDSKLDERCDIVDSAHGVWRCHFAGACTEFCPKGVDPAMGAQLVKQLVVLRKVFGGKRKKPAPIVPEPTGAVKREGIPAPPPKTV